MSPGEFVRRMLDKRQQPSREPRTRTTYRPPEGFSDRVKNKIVPGRSGGWCELDLCGPAVTFHHRRPRGSGGTSLDWVDLAANCLHLSHRCHLWVEGRSPGSSRKRSGVLGWLVSLNTGQRAEQVPVWYRGAWVYLRNNGAVVAIDDADLIDYITPEEFHLP